MTRRKPSVASANRLLGLLLAKDYRRLNTLLAPVVGLILCVPHYVQGTMLLGDVTQAAAADVTQAAAADVTQAAAAFVAVQGAFNWLIDNFPRLAECLSSANRVGNLLTAFDQLKPAEHGGG
jgi:putative ATP-binding cassette transporter